MSNERNSVRNCWPRQGGEEGNHSTKTIMLPDGTFPRVRRTVADYITELQAENERLRNTRDSDD